MGRLTASIRSRPELSTHETERMFELYDAYYDGSSLATFSRDLSRKSHVIELRAEGRLCGFSTLALMPFEIDGVPNLAIFSGDTIIHHEYWGEQALAGAFCRFAGRTKAENPQHPLFWFLVSKGHRTYRYLSVFSHDYYPNHARPTPRPIQQRMDLLARMRFGDDYDAAAGIVRFAQSQGHLRPRWADVRDPLRRNPVVDFFLARNPNHHEGDELVCMTELSVENMRSVARLAFVEGLNASVDDNATR